MKRNLVSSAVLFILVILIASGCTQKDNLNNNNDTIPNEINKDETTPKEIVPVKYEPVNTEQEIFNIEKNLIKERILSNQINDHTIIVFSTHDDVDNLYAGIEINDILYDLGKVSMYSTERVEELVDISVVNIGQKELIKIVGILGANYAQTKYYYIQNNTPYHFLTTEGYAEEIDIDSDEVKEILASVGTIPSTYIFKVTNDEIVKVNLNELLEAVAVLPIKGQKGYFEAYFDDIPNTPFVYKYYENSLKLQP